MGYEPVTIREAAQLEVLLFVALAFLGSLGVIYWGLQTYRFGRIIRDTPPEPVRSVAMGRTEVRGKILPHRRIYDRPFTDGQCVYGEYKVREYREYPNDDDKDDEWKTIETGSFGTSFYIEDDTGKILVEPNEDTLFEISDEYSNRIEISKGDTPPPPVQEFLGSGVGARAGSTDDGESGGLFSKIPLPFFGGDSSSDELEGNVDPVAVDDRGDRTPEVQSDHHTDSGGGPADTAAGPQSDYEHITRQQIGSSSSTSRKRQYIQRVLPVEDETYVFGGATRRDPADVGEDDVAEVIRADPGTEEFIISDKDEFELAKQYSRRSLLYIISGLLCSAMILAVLAQILITGPVYGIEAALP